MMKKFLIPAACNPSTICRRIGFPRTLIIGFGRSAVSSRIRVPRPAASKTALSIFVITGFATIPHLALRVRSPALDFQDTRSLPLGETHAEAAVRAREWVAGKG